MNLISRRENILGCSQAVKARGFELCTVGSNPTIPATGGYGLGKPGSIPGAALSQHKRRRTFNF